MNWCILKQVLRQKHVTEQQTDRQANMEVSHPLPNIYYHYTIIIIQ